MQRSRTTIVLAASILLCASPALGATIYVDDSATGANNGASWASAFNDPHDAFAIALSGDEIRIGQGTYKPAGPNGSREATFTLPVLVVIRGGYAGTGAPNPDATDPDQYETFFSGDLNGNDGKPGSWFGYEENSYHVVTVMDNPAVDLHGLIIRSGNADDPTFEGVNNQGGGILCINSTLSIYQCTIEDSQAWLSGGGVQASTLHAEDSVIRRNRQTHSFSGAGGVASGSGSTFLNCRFEDNRAGSAATAGALSIHNSTIDDCIFIGNYASEQGGAIAAQGTVSISESQFLGNGAGVEGGAIVVFGGTLTIADSSLIDNGSNGGGAISASAPATVSIRDCEFENNLGTIGGALNSYGTMFAVRSRFTGNSIFTSAGGAGGAIANHGQLDLVNCAFQSNSSHEFAGTILNFGQLQAVNCRFNSNYAEEQGGVLFNDADATFINCTVAGNWTRIGSVINDSGALHNADDGNLVVNNCILWANESANGQTGETAQIWNQDGGTLSINNSCVQGWSGAYGGKDNTGADPQMISASNFRLTATSPCINAGSNAWLPNDDHDLDDDGNTAETLPLDLDLHARIVASVVDMGAYEFPEEGCAADIAPPQGNGTVDVDDLLVVINNWGPCEGEPCEGDVTDNGIVDVDDLLLVINNWGGC